MAIYQELHSAPAHMNTRTAEVARMRFKRYLVLDLEATCSDTGEIPREQMEIIEVGAVMVDGMRLEPIDAFQSFIRPVRHPRLMPFCTALTSIRQADVDAAPDFPAFAQAFKAWLYRYHGFAFCSWGNYDRSQLAQDCASHQLPNPIGAPHLNLKVLFSARQGLNRKLGLQGALSRAQLAFEGTPHRGIDDARNAARLLPFIVGDRQIPGPRH